MKAAAYRSNGLGNRYFKIWLPVLSVSLFLGASELACHFLHLAPRTKKPILFTRRIANPYADPGHWVRRLDNDVSLDYMTDDWLLLWSPLPGYADDSYQISSVGFRDREYPVDKPAGAFRILCLGDSSTFGYEVAESQTYHALLEEELNRRRPFGRERYELINAGVTGYTSAQCLSLYQHKGRPYGPDLVTAWIGLNDMKLTFTFNDRELLEARSTCFARSAKRANDLLEDLDCYRAFCILLRRETGFLQFSDEGRPRVGLADFQRNLRELNRMCVEHGSPLVLMQFTRRKDAALEKNLASYRQAMEDVAREQRIPLFSVPEMTERADSPNEHLFLDSCHPNPQGHALIAERLHSFLMAEGLLDDRRS